jgi:hypothetical protein
MTEETFEQFKERVSQLNYEELLGQTVMIIPGRDDSEEKKKKLALLDDLIAEFDPFDEYSQKRQKGLPMEKPDDFIRRLQADPKWRAKYWPGLKYDEDMKCIVIEAGKRD